MADDLGDDLRAFWEDLDLEAEASGEPLSRAFFTMFSRLAAGNGDCVDLEYTPVIRDGRGGYRIDGFGLDLDRGELHIAVCDFRQSRELETCNTRDLDSLFQRVRQFVELATDPSFVTSLEETSPAFEAAYPIYTHQTQIRRIRILILSNARLSTRGKPEAGGEISGRAVVRNVLDFRRYADIVRSKGAPEATEIDLAELNGGPLPCLRAHGSSGTYEAYLVAVPGELLAKVYGLWGAQLLEQNVRTFLQAKTKVNKGIIDTIQNYPGMFFAYNNGLTATASGIDLTSTKDGGLGIATIRNLQIVNGGQTTASILYAKDQAKASLDEVFVQMKLSVVEPALVDEIVPDISRYANTQNKVSEADFFSNHPFHVEMEKLSRRIAAPPKPGMLAGSKWFYERARGQYRYGQAYGSAAERRKFEIEFPREQMVEKTDFAKYALTFECKPHIVSRLAQKSFLAFAEQVSDDWIEGQSSFDESYFRAMMAKALLFRRIDKRVSSSAWYKSDRGHKLQVITYTCAWLVDHLLKARQAELNFMVIWNAQDVPEELQDVLLDLAPQVAATLKDAPPSIRDVGEYCKQKVCWDNVSARDFRFRQRLDGLLVARDVRELAEREERRNQRKSRDSEFDGSLAKLAPAAERIASYARAHRLLSLKSNAALHKLANKGTLSQPERNALKYLIERLEQRGVDLAKL
jgi:hypothetical protein